MIELPEFRSFGKIPRLSRDITITEKIDGTNGVIYVSLEMEVMAGSKSRWLSPEKSLDNHGFAAWVRDHAKELAAGLGAGYHYGEWWGQGINRGYGLKEKRFSLFNLKRWGDPEKRPTCCHVVPALYTGPFDTERIEATLWSLAFVGSWAAPGFKNPEGIVIYHHAGNLLFKKTIERDEQPKGENDGGA